MTNQEVFGLVIFGVFVLESLCFLNSEFKIQKPRFRSKDSYQSIYLVSSAPAPALLSLHSAAPYHLVSGGIVVCGRDCQVRHPGSIPGWLDYVL